MSLRLAACATAAAAMLAWSAGDALAQDEDVEPRVIGRAGTLLVGVSGFLDRSYSREELMPANYTVQVDAERFVSRRFAIRLGVSGSGRFGGSDSDTIATGPGAAALHAYGGALFYFTPESIMSPYLATEYWNQITRRGDTDAGSAVGKAGLQAAVSSRASFFVEAGFGFGLRKGSEGELPTRVVGQIGLRIKVH
jgi:hypothetical protein